MRAKLLTKWAGWETYDMHDIHTERCGRAGKCIIVDIQGAALKGKDIPRNGSNVAGTELDARARIVAHLAAAAKGEYAGGVVAAMADEDEDADTDTDDDEEIVLEKETTGRSTPARPVLKLQKTRAFYAPNSYVGESGCGLRVFFRSPETSQAGQATH